MVEDGIVSEADLLDRLRKRKPVFADIAEAPMTVQEVDLEFRAAMFGTLIALVLIAVLAFNLAAPRP